MTGVTSFEWTDGFLLGYEAMDRTHQEFVELVQALLVVDDAGMPAALDAFAEHAERHFADEKEWMGDDFPARECHIDEHGKVLASLREVRHHVAQGQFAVGRSFAEALMDWFPGHADYMDAALAVWISKKKFGGAPVVIKRNQAA
jgi:hemerythrin